MRELTSEDLVYFSEFRRLTAITPNDFINTSASIVFVVDAHDLGEAIGKGGVNIKKLNQRFKKTVSIVADSKDPETFVRCFFYNINIISTEIVEAGGKKTMFLTINENDRGIAIGKGGERIKAAKAFLNKKFGMNLSLRTKRVL